MRLHAGGALVGCCSQTVVVIKAAANPRLLKALIWYDLSLTYVAQIFSDFGDC